MIISVDLGAIEVQQNTVRACSLFYQRLISTF